MTCLQRKMNAHDGCLKFVVVQFLHTLRECDNAHRRNLGRLSRYYSSRLYAFALASSAQTPVIQEHQIRQMATAAGNDPRPEAQPQKEQAISGQKLTEFFQHLRERGLTAVMDFSCCST